ncbi:MAG: hypothetical protein ABR500_03410 [Dermatophilaceae bacterium]|nr:hypothetical protein [Intrasporangiaceae bacterium]
MTLLSACSSAIEVAPPDQAGDPACAEIPWPETIAGNARTATDPEGSWVAAWGDPAIIARCGLPALEPTTLDCVAVDDMDWIVRELSDGTAMSSYGTDPALEVLVPVAYGPGPLLLPAFGDAVRSLPTNGRQCE